jgi:hypothetical protein
MMGLRERIAIHKGGHCCAAITFSIPVISVTTAADRPHLHRGRYCAPAGFVCFTCLSLDN